MSQTTKPKTPFDFAAAITQPFRLPGGRGLLFRILFWTTLLYALIFGLFGVKIISAYAEVFQNIMAMENSSNPDDPEAALAAMAPMFAIMGLAFIVSLASWAINVSAETAMHRNIFHGEDRGLFPLWFGHAEWRVTLAQLVVAVIVYGAYIAGYIAFIIIAMIAAVSAEAAPALGVVMGILAALTLLAMMLAALTALIKFAPAAAMSVRDQEIRTLEGWNATKGRFWPLLGSYLVVGIGGYIAIILLFVVFALLAFGDFSMFADLETTAGGSPELVFAQLGEIFRSPRVLIPLLIGGVVTTLFSLLWYMCLWGIPNYAAQLNAQDNISVDEAFS